MRSSIGTSGRWSMPSAVRRATRKRRAGIRSNSSWTDHFQQIALESALAPFLEDCWPVDVTVKEAQSVSWSWPFPLIGVAVTLKLAGAVDVAFVRTGWLTW